MLNKNMNKQEIEEFLNTKGNFMQIDYLKRFLNESPPLDKRKFALLKLTEVYEKLGMCRECAQMFHNLAMISITFADKIQCHIKEAEICIRGGFFDLADKAMNKAMSEANSRQKKEVYDEVVRAYKEQASIYEAEVKRNSATRIYEKLLSMNLSDLEKQEIRGKLIYLYERLGKFKEARFMEGL